MKINNTTKESNKGFKPQQITITVKTQEEYNALIDMCLHNTSIPKLCMKSNYKTIQSFLQNFQKVLTDW